MVVGSGQSGCQIAEDLHLAGRRVHLCVGSAPRTARWYRGKDVVEWLDKMGHYDLPVHEHLEVDGVIGDLCGHLDHHTHPTVASHEMKIERYTSLSADDRIRNGKPEAAWYHLLVNPVWTFLKFYLFRRGFRDGLPGLIVSGFSAAHVLLKYAKLWERAHVSPSGV